MIDYIENEAGHFVEIHINGKITSEDIDSLWPKLEKRISEWGSVNILKKFDKFHGVEPTAVWHNLSQGLSKLSHFGSVAIVTDMKWMETLSRGLSKISGKAVKCFPSDELENARAWLKEQK